MLKSIYELLPPEAWLSGAVVILAVVAHFFLTDKIWWTRPKKVEETPPPAPKTFIEEVLEASLKGEGPPRQPGKPYTWEEYRRDLFDNGLSFDEIYERSGGIFPQKPEEPDPKSPGKTQYLGSSGPGGCQGSNGPSGQDGSQRPNGSDGRCPERLKELQEWFKQRAEQVGEMKVVPPPPPPKPVLQVKAWTKHCPDCISGLVYARNPQNPMTRLTCRTCGGSGIITITGG